MEKATGSNPQPMEGLPAKPRFEWMGSYGGERRYLMNNLYRPDGSDALHFFDPDAPKEYQPQESVEPILTLSMNQRQMEELRDALIARLENWGKP